MCISIAIIDENGTTKNLFFLNFSYLFLVFFEHFFLCINQRNHSKATWRLNIAADCLHIQKKTILKTMKGGQTEPIDWDIN